MVLTCLWTEKSRRFETVRIYDMGNKGSRKRPRKFLNFLPDDGVVCLRPLDIVIRAAAFTWAFFSLSLAEAQPTYEQAGIDVSERAKEGLAGPVRHFDIRRVALHSALIKFARQADMQIAWHADDFRGLEAGRVIGEMSPAEALAELLGPSGATFSMTSQRVVTIQAPDAPAAIEQKQEAQVETLREANTYQPYRLPDRDEITVTGTRLKALEEDRRFASRHALTTNDVSQSGYNDFLNAIADLPTVNAPTTPENTQTSIPSSGQSFIEMRGLDANRTLVLFDGRRSVSNSYTSNRVDLNTVPLDLVKRVEFVKGGASAVYGVDAIAGAVNIIFNDDFEGVRLRTRGGLAQQGGGEEFGASLLYGGDVADGGGRIVLYAGVDRENPIRATDRDFATISAEFDTDENLLETPDFSGSVPGGRFPRPGPDFFFDETGLRDDYSLDQNGFAFRPFSTLSIPQTRYYASALFEHAVTPAIELFSTTHWTTMATKSTRAPETISDRDTGLLIPLNNPFLPDAIRNDAQARAAEGVQYRRRLSELGNRGREADRSTVRHWTGLHGTLPYRNFRWEAVAGYNRYRQDQMRLGLIVVPNFVNALNVEPDPQNTGSFRCVDANARADGCVPINIFGVGSIGKEAADYIRHNDHINALIEQYTVSFSASGTMAQIPSGSVDVAVGADWRRNSLRLDTDPVNAAGATSANPIVPFEGQQSAYDIFGEARIPLLTDQPFAQSLSVQGASRLTFFSEGPNNLGVSYNIKAAWTPASAINFVVGYAQSIREADLTERFSPPRGDSDDFEDPCNGVMIATDIVSTNCLMDAGINAAVIANGSFLQEATSISGPNAGNRDLTFEKSRALSARFALAPDIQAAPTIIVEYFNVVIDDAIEAFSSDQIARQCYLRTDSGRQEFCNLITRNNAGQVTEILNQQLNLITVESAGIETELSWALPIDVFDLSGDISFSARHTRLFKLEERFDSPLNGGVIDNDRGEPGSAKDTALFIGEAALGDFSARWRSQYFSATIDSDSRTELFRELGVEEPLFFKIPASWRHDIYLEWRQSDHEFKLFAGVNNFLNDTGPFFPSGTIQGGSDNHITEFDVVGRYFFAGVEKSF